MSGLFHYITVQPWGMPELARLYSSVYTVHSNATCVDSMVIYIQVLLSNTLCMLYCGFIKL